MILGFPNVGPSKTNSKHRNNIIPIKAWTGVVLLDLTLFDNVASPAFPIQHHIGQEIYKAYL